MCIRDRYEINGPMFFGMTDRISDISVKSFTKYLIIRMRGVPSLDSTGMNALENLYGYCRENGVRLALLKAKSPSCGFGQVYDGTFTGTLVAGRGLTAELLSDAGVRVLTENDLDLLASLKTQEDPAC